MFPVPFSLFPQDCLPFSYLGSVTTAKKNPAKKEKCSKSLKDTERRGMAREDSRDDDLLVSSFCERINYSANQVVTLWNTLLGDNEMEKLVMCRMNRDFIIFIRENYLQVAIEQFEFGTMLPVEDNEEDGDD